jgi:putative aldouronate transport system permease protein
MSVRKIDWEDLLFSLFVYLILILICILTLYPFIYVLSVSIQRCG